MKERSSMSGMYPNNQALEIFGEQVLWPGTDPETGKFTNGSFENPMVKPSFIPAETLNLVLDNLSALIAKCGGAPNSVSGSQLADLVTSLALANKIVMRDPQGRARVAAPYAREDIARLADVLESAGRITPDGFGLYQEGPNFFDILNVSSAADAIGEIHERNGSNAADKYAGFKFGAYIDGIDLSGIPAENEGTAGQPWNDAYKNNRIVLSAINPYKGVGDTEVTKDHVRFDFANVPLLKRMNPVGENMGGYPATEMRAFLDGANGDGTGGKEGVTTAAFLNILKARIGDCILPVRRLLSTKGSWAWVTCSLWLPSENEVFGANAFGEPGWGDGQKLHVPLYQKSYAHRIKRHNGSRNLWWLNSPGSDSLFSFCYVRGEGTLSGGSASLAGGCSPAFCIA
jgi:hypothetical protein